MRSIRSIAFLATALLLACPKTETPSADPDARIDGAAYRELVADPTGVVGRVCDAADLPLNEEALAQRIADRPQNRHGKHEYDLAEHGLSDADVRERFAVYTSRFDAFL